MDPMAYIVVGASFLASLVLILVTHVSPSSSPRWRPLEKSLQQEPQETEGSQSSPSLASSRPEIQEGESSATAPRLPASNSSRQEIDLETQRREDSGEREPLLPHQQSRREGQGRGGNSAPDDSLRGSSSSRNARKKRWMPKILEHPVEGDEVSGAAPEEGEEDSNAADGRETCEAATHSLVAGLGVIAIGVFLCPWLSCSVGAILMVLGLFKILEACLLAACPGWLDDQPLLYDFSGRQRRRY